MSRSLSTEVENRIFLDDLVDFTTQMQELSKNSFDLISRLNNISLILNENRILRRDFDIYSDTCSSMEKDHLVSVYQGNRDGESLLTVWIVY